MATNRIGKDSTTYDTAITYAVPKAISYSAGLINFFFRGNIDASLDTSGKVVLKNLGPFLPSGTFELWYDDNNNLRYNSGWKWSTFSGLPTGTTINTDLSPSTTITSNLSPGRFVLVYRSSDFIQVGSRLVAGKIVTLAPEAPPPPPPPPTGCTPATFTDNFNRADGVVGNGWSNTSGNINGSYVIKNNELTASNTDGRAGIYRPLAFSAPVTVSATIKDTNGADGPLRYDSGFSFLNNGSYRDGYGLYFGRSDLAFNNSHVWVSDNHSVLGLFAVPFQFGSQISTNFTWKPDGSISGTVTSGTNTASFAFGAHAFTGTGSNFSISSGFADGSVAPRIDPRIDDLSITCTP